ncbi:Uncharacterized protein Rs2_14274 [Raphanus sativus]|nr:Uncharacterized protein Rs2_14274 [Raphanus sativus]
MAELTTEQTSRPDRTLVSSEQCRRQKLHPSSSPELFDRRVSSKPILIFHPEPAKSSSSTSSLPSSENTLDPPEVKSQTPLSHNRKPESNQSRRQHRRDRAMQKQRADRSPSSKKCNAGSLADRPPCNRCDAGN